METDLVVLVADKDMRLTLRGVLSRPLAVGIRPIAFDIYTHYEHDGACATEGVSFLSRFSRTHAHGLLLFDHEGSGREDSARVEIQEALNYDLSVAGWDGRAQAIVITPELEAWVWSDSPHLDEVTGWKGRNPSLREWLRRSGHLREGEVKPSRPKEAFRAALRQTRVPRSSALFEMLAERVSLRRCEDESFLELSNTLRAWFPPE